MAGEALAAQHAALSARLQRALAVEVRRIWESIPDLSDRSLEAWLARVRPVVAGAQLRSSQLMQAYLVAVIAEVTGEAPRPAAVDRALVIGAAIRNGTDPDTVYRRPVAQARWLISAGRPAVEAFRQGGTRAVHLATTDLQLARTHTSRQILRSDDRVVGYRRVLSGSENCALCVTASTQRYRTEDLMPIHPGCDCDVSVIVGNQDPGRVINPDLLEANRAMLSERFGADAVNRHGNDAGELRNLVTTYEHGEYGPTLTIDRHHHRGASEALSLAE